MPRVKEMPPQKELLAHEAVFPEHPLVEFLTNNQKSYVLARYGGQTPAEAAGTAGYSSPDKTCYDLERNPRIRLALQELRHADISEAAITRKKILDGMMDAVRSAATSTELLNAWREIAKLLGEYEPAKLTITHQLAEKSAEELKAVPTDQLLKALGNGAIDLEGFLNGAIIEGEFEEVTDDRPATGV